TLLAPCMVTRRQLLPATSNSRPLGSAYRGGRTPSITASGRPEANSNTTRSYPSCVPTRTSVIWARWVVDATVTDGTHANGTKLSVGSLAAADASTLAGTDAAVDGWTLG